MTARIASIAFFVCTIVCCGDGAVAARRATATPTPIATGTVADKCPFILQLDSTDGKSYAAVFYGPAAVTSAIDLRLYAKDAEYVAHVARLDISTPYQIADGRTWFRSATLSLEKPSGQPLIAATADATLDAATAPCETRETLIAPPLAVIASRKRDGALPPPAMRIALERTKPTHFDCSTPFAFARTARVDTPPYPEDALQARRGGKARVLVFIDEAGSVTGTSLLGSTGVPSLDAAALAGARATSYVPQRFACKAETGSYVFRVDFSP